jgi:dienelactone hydrolase
VQGSIAFASSSPVDLDALLPTGDAGPFTAGTGILELPGDREPPYPLMVILPGSGGDWTAHRIRYASLLGSWGIASFFVDYYSPRGVSDATPYDLKVTRVSEFDLVADAYGALRHLSTHPDIDVTRIGLMGFSYGGTAARLALDLRFRSRLVPESPAFALHIDFYGPCNLSPSIRNSTGAPLLALYGAKDVLTQPSQCARRVEELRSAGTPVESHRLPGAGHAWDAAVPAEFRASAQYLGDCEIVYDQQGVARLDGSDGAVIVNPEELASHEDRLNARAASWSLFQDCIRRGYLHGGDSAAAARGVEILHQFLVKQKFVRR